MSMALKTGVDRNGSIPLQRGYYSTYNYTKRGNIARGCPVGQDADEYPPATFEENQGTAHIKCINSRDNQDSGNSFANSSPGGLRNYRFSNDKILDDSVVEFVLK